MFYLCHSSCESNKRAFLQARSSFWSSRYLIQWKLIRFVLLGFSNLWSLINIQWGWSSRSTSYKMPKTYHKLTMTLSMALRRKNVILLDQWFLSQELLRYCWGICSCMKLFWSFFIFFVSFDFMFTLFWCFILLPFFLHSICQSFVDT